MKLQSTQLTHIGRFESASIDLSSIPDTAKIVCFDGITGAGKSTLAEALTGGALFREFRNSGNLAAMATARDSSIVTCIHHAGVDFQVHHTIDGKKGDSVLSSGVMAYNQDAHRESFDAEVAKAFPPEKLLYNTIWREQQSRGFLQMREGERRELVLLATGATKWEGWAKACRDRAKGSEGDATRIRSQIMMLPAHNIETLTDDIANMHLQVKVRLLPQVGAAQSDLDVARQAAGDSAVARAEYERQVKALADRKEREHFLNQDLTVTAFRLGKNRQLLEQADSIRAAHTEVEAAKVKLTECKENYASARLGEQSFASDVFRCNGHALSCKQSVTRYELALKDAAIIEHAKASIPEWEKDVEIAEREVSKGKAEIERISSLHISGKDERIGILRNGLGCIADYQDRSTLFCKDVAAATLTEDDAAQNLAVSIPKQLEQLRHDLEGDESELASSRHELRRLESLAAKADQIAADRTSLEQAKAELKLAGDAAAQAESNRVLAAEACAVVRRKCEELHAIVTGPKAQLSARLSELSAAEALVNELTPRETELTRQVEVLRAELDSTPEPTPPEQAPNLAALEQSLRDAQTAHSAAVSALGAAEERLRQARETAERIDALRVDLAAAEREASEWQRLADDLGREGIQAALVDAAGPELTQTCNYLLRECFGSRWTLQVSTQRQSADGKRMLEECEVRVIDEGDESENAAPRQGEGRTFSGGEKEILNLAFQLALAHLARQAGITNPDLLLDEPAATLNEEKRARWVRMLRLAADVIGAGHVFVITHSEDIKALADARIVVERGDVTINA